MSKHLMSAYNETKVMLDLIVGVSDHNYRNHACTRLWWCYPGYLGLYRLLAKRELVSRGYGNMAWTEFDKNALTFFEVFLANKPPHTQDRDYLEAHRIHLLGKGEEEYGHYSQFFPELARLYTYTECVEISETWEHKHRLYWGLCKGAAKALNVKVKQWELNNV
jgi:hypothetical protein